MGIRVKKPKNFLRMVHGSSEILRQPCRRWSLKVMNRKELKQLINDMFWFLNGKGLGLAAPQIGVPLQICVIACPERVALVNPKIVEAHGKSLDKEGCLSFPGKKVQIERANIVTIVYESPFTGNEVRRTFKGLEARCVQHELDHLNGKTILDHDAGNGNNQATGGEDDA